MLQEKTIETLTDNEFLDIMHNKFSKFITTTYIFHDEKDLNNFINEMNSWYVRAIEFERYEWCNILQNILNYINAQLCISRKFDLNFNSNKYILDSIFMELFNKKTFNYGT